MTEEYPEWGRETKFCKKKKKFCTLRLTRIKIDLLVPLLMSLTWIGLSIFSLLL